MNVMSRREPSRHGWQTCISLQAVSTTGYTVFGSWQADVRVAAVLGRGSAIWDVALGLQQQKRPFSDCAKLTCECCLYTAQQHH